ncbi:phosphoribosylamine--glycine ligase [Patescibacteria group bacterium]|nr:phosphoribosylamine--glycine ligase [Patescibacteria group bacterium]
MKKILIVGGGGREAALVQKLSALELELHCAPGNAGIARFAELHPVPANDLPAQVALAQRTKADLVVIGPEDPLAAGLVNQLRAKQISVFGPSAAATQIEASKVWCKRLLQEAGIPTPISIVFSNPASALNILRLREAEYPLVIKADGLAQGKGVKICRNFKDAEAAVRQIMVERKFGDAGKQILVEEFLTGRECYLMVLTDGVNVIPLPLARDFKRAQEDDRGENTGGMGSFAPVPDVDSALKAEIMETIIYPTLAALRKVGCFYQGVLYAGIMLTDRGPMVLEYNCRFGDPEIQAVLPLLTAECFSDLLFRCASSSLRDAQISWVDQSAVCIVLASGGYPGPYEKGLPISGLDAAGALDGVQVLHAGTALDNAGRTVTAGGRVLNIVGTAQDLPTARERALQGVRLINFDGMQFRSDIAKDI